MRERLRELGENILHSTLIGLVMGGIVVVAIAILNLVGAG